jgi:hypothetical protein
MREGGRTSRRALQRARMPSARLHRTAALASFAFSGAALRKAHAHTPHALH